MNPEDYTDEEVEVTVTTRMVKQTYLYADGAYDAVEYEIEPDGTRTAIHYRELPDLKGCYEDQEYTLRDILQKTIKVAQAVKQQQKSSWFAHVNLQKLIDSCAGWDDEKTAVERVECKTNNDLIDFR